MKKLFPIAIALIAVAAIGAAHAADLPNVKGPPAFAPPPPPVFSWTGFYVGANVGYGWGESTGSLDPNFPNLFGAATAVAGGFIPSRLGVRPQGVIGGGQIGFNWQNGPWVLGVETDMQGSGIENSNTIAFSGPVFVPSTTTASDRLDWFGTARARAGWLALPNLLLYGTGGVAYGYTHDNYSLIGTPPTAGDLLGSAGGVRAGWAAGAGVEWKITPNISIKAEYLHVDLGSTTVHTTDPLGTFPGTFFDYHFHTEDDIARVGVNYQFDWLAPLGPVVAKY
jgi:outer membrane immunogenic protein